MDFGQVDGMDFPAQPMYYPGYYDENGMFVIRKFLHDDSIESHSNFFFFFTTTTAMYNGYNYYPNSSGPTPTSPVFLMPYPSYQYDQYYMPSTSSPVSEQQADQSSPVDDEEDKLEQVDDKTCESNGAKDNNNQNAENQNVSLLDYLFTD